jgi:SAM-dependent methyltransferase
MDICAIDWNEAWKEKLTSSFDAIGAEEYWDRRAPAFARPESGGPYVEQFLRLLSLQSDWRVLDVGCGTGALTVPLAPLVGRITALDISSAMLDSLRTACRHQNIRNVHTVRASWTDDWRKLDIEPHEVVIASRSLIVPDLTRAIDTLNRFALHRVYISVPVGDGPLDPALFQAIGRPWRRGPDYIYVYNLLYQMGIHANLAFITYREDKPYPDLMAAMTGLKNRTGDLLPSEEASLKKYIDQTFECRDGRWQLRDARTIRWAVIWWEPSDRRHNP